MSKNDLHPRIPTASPASPVAMQRCTDGTRFLKRSLPASPHPHLYRGCRKGDANYLWTKKKVSAGHMEGVETYEQLR